MKLRLILSSSVFVDIFGFKTVVSVSTSVAVFTIIESCVEYIKSCLMYSSGNDVFS